MDLQPLLSPWRRYVFLGEQSAIVSETRDGRPSRWQRASWRGMPVMRNGIGQILLYPLRFEPIYQYRLWGGRRLADLLTAPMPSGPIGEAWILSDRDDHASQVADGPLRGQTISQLLNQSPKQMLGKLAGRFRRFPLLLKFIDAHEMLSIQVHPSDAHKDLLPAGVQN
jgi:Phosphomannose isomerase type I